MVTSWVLSAPKYSRQKPSLPSSTVGSSGITTNPYLSLKSTLAPAHVQPADVIERDIQRDLQFQGTGRVLLWSWLSDLCPEVGFEDDNLRNKPFFTLLSKLISVPKSNQLYIIFASHRVAWTELFSCYSFNLEVRLKKISYMHSVATMTPKLFMRRTPLINSLNLLIRSSGRKQPPGKTVSVSQRKTSCISLFP